jgi:hypothetical protein
MQNAGRESPRPAYVEDTMVTHDSHRVLLAWIIVIVVVKIKVIVKRR